MAQATSPAAARARSLDGSRWLVLAVLLCGSFLVITSVSLVNLAIPAIRSTLGASFGEIELVVAGYTLVYAILLIAGGRLGDIFGRKGVFLAGVALFTVAAAGCALAPNTLALILARGLQGVGAALMYPQMLAIIQTTFEEPKERNLALGMFGSMIGVGFIAGQVLAGVLIQLDVAGLSWRLPFLVLVVLGVAAGVGGSAFLRGGGGDRSGRLDIPGLVLFAVGIGLLVYPLVAGRDAGWPVWMIVMLVVSVPVLVAFALVERQVAARGGRPLLNLGLFGQRAFAVGCLISLIFLGVCLGFIFVTSVTLQVGLGFSPAEVGLTMVPQGLAFFAASLLAPRLVNGLGRHSLTVGYGVLGIATLAVLTVVLAAGSRVTLPALLPAFILLGAGQGLGTAPLFGTVLGGVRRQDMGSAAGALPTSFQIGQVMGVALIGLLYFAVLAGQPASAGQADRYLAAYEAALVVLAAATFLCLLLVFALPRPASAQHDNPLMERVPHRFQGLIHSVYFITGGQLGGRPISELVHHNVEHRASRMEGAPLPPGELMAYYFERSFEDGSWYRYLAEEGLHSDGGKITFEDERRSTIERQVEEIRQRQAQGLIGSEFDPATLRLALFALTAYPHVLPQMVRMATGLAPDSDDFKSRWRTLLEQLGERLAPAAAAAAAKE